MCIFHRNTCFGDSVCVLFLQVCRGDLEKKIARKYRWFNYQSPIQTYHNISINKEENQEHFNHSWEEYICKHLKQFTAASTGIRNIAQTLFHYTNPTSSSQTRIHSAAAAEEGFSHAETRLPHTCHSHLLTLSVSAHCC